MGVLSAAEKDEIDVVSAGIHVPGARSAAWPPAASGGRWRPIAGPVRPRPAGAHSLTRGEQAPGEQAPGEQAPGRRVAGRRVLHVREVRVSELHVSEFRAAERQADGVRTRSARGRQVRSVTVRARAVRAASVRGTVGARGADPRGDAGGHGAGVRRSDLPGGLRAAGPVTPDTGHAGQLRLTSRGRAVLAAVAIVVVTAVVTAMLCWLGAVGGAQAASSRIGPGTAHRGLAQVVVQPGQTLWSIARQAEPAADPRGVVQQIIEVNALGGATIQAGQLLWVPGG